MVAPWHWLKDAITTPNNTLTDNSLANIIYNGGGLITRNVVKLNGTGAVTVNIFKVDFPVFADQLSGFITAITDITDITLCHFDFWDGTASKPLTKAAAAPAMSGFAIQGGILKGEIATVVANVTNGNEGQVVEFTGARASQGFALSRKFGADNYIRFNYTNGDTNLDIDVSFGVRWVSGTINAVVAV